MIISSTEKYLTVGSISFNKERIKVIIKDNDIVIIDASGREDPETAPGNYMRVDYRQVTEPAIFSKDELYEYLIGEISNSLPIIQNIEITPKDNGFIVTADVISRIKAVITVSYGLTSEYGSVQEVVANSPVVGTKNISATITGLNSYTNYHFKIRASSLIGTTDSPDEILFCVESVNIGSQTWALRNYNSRFTPLGNEIPLITNGATWGGLLTPGCCYYNYGPDLGEGLLFNLQAVQLIYNDILDYNQSHPENYFLFRPFLKAEALTLQSQLGGSTAAGGHLKKTGLTSWSSPNTGADNSSGFTALGTGIIQVAGGIYGRGIQAFMWGADGSDILLSNNNASMIIANEGTHSAKYGFALRMIKSEPIVFLTAGQSNADGRVPLVNAPLWLSQADPKLDYASMWKNTTSEFLPFKLGVNTGADSNLTTLWAFDMVVYHLMQLYKKTNVFAIKRTHGGAAISEFGTNGGGYWQPDFTKVPSGHVLLREFETYITNAIIKLGASKKYIKAFLWHQGEGDSLTLAAPHYYTNLKALIAHVRSHVSNPNLPFIMGTISHTSAQYNAIVEAAQLQIAGEDDNVYVVNMSEGTLLDPYHFDAVSSEALGTAVYNIIKDF